MDWQAELDWTLEAIQKVRGGAQEYYVGNRRVRYPDMATLIKDRNYLASMVDRADGTNPMFGVAAVDRPR